MTGALRQLQVYIGDTITIASVPYTCTESESPGVDYGYEAGGALATDHASVIVSKSDLAIEPNRGTIVAYRSLNYRVTDVDDLIINWEIHLIQLSA